MVLKILEREGKKTAQSIRTYDKRYFPRWEVNKPVEYLETGGVVLRSYTRDLSLDGASLVVPGNPPARHRVQIRIHMTNKVHFEARGRIAWSKAGSTHKLLGIVFDRLSRQGQELIMCHAFELREDHLLMYGLLKSLILKGCFSSKRTLRPNAGPPLRQQ